MCVFTAVNLDTEGRLNKCFYFVFTTVFLYFTACYGIVQVPTGPWFCRKCESQERAARVVSCIWEAEKCFCVIMKLSFLQRCELCPSRDGALKRTDTNSWAHVVCALYIPEVRFGNVSTMEPIVLGLVPQERYLKVSKKNRKFLWQKNLSKWM